MLVDGGCQCEDRQMIFSKNGFCVHCRVPGCSQCELSSPFKCIQCDSTMQLTESSQCSCQNPEYSLTTANQCGLCFILGCEMCVDGEQDVCAVCADRSASIIDGSCVCPLGSYMQANGSCLLCWVDGCDICSGEECIECGEGKVLRGDRCECRNSQFHLEYGKCQCPTHLKEAGASCIDCRNEECL